MVFMIFALFVSLGITFLSALQDTHVPDKYKNTVLSSTAGTGLYHMYRVAT